jgi:hypothetical protein
MKGLLLIHYSWRQVEIFMDRAIRTHPVDKRSMDRSISDIFPTSVLHSCALSDILSNERRL